MKIATSFGGERRKDRRIRLRPIVMVIDDVAYTTMDWGFGGFSVEGYRGERQVGDTVSVTIVVNDGRNDVENIAKARIVRIEEETRKLAAAFGTLDIQIVSFLDSWLTGRLVRHGGRRQTDQATERPAGTVDLFSLP